MIPAPTVPPLVREALVAATASGFEQSCSVPTGRLLHTLAAQVREGRIGELGTGCGVGAAWMASALEPSAELYTVERDEALAHGAASVFGDLGNVTVVHGDWSAISAHAPFRMLFCDAAAPKRDEIDATIALLTVGGIIVLDDYTELSRPDDTSRDAWLLHPHLVTTEVLVSPTEAVVLGVRR